MNAVKGMRAAPQVFSRLSQLRRDPNVDLKDVTILLARDSKLNARILRVANSAVYRQGPAYSSLEQALDSIGFGEIYTIAGIAAMEQMSDQDLGLYGVTGAEIRDNSLLTALIAEALAQSADTDIHEAYSAGLLRSVGKIALDGLVHNAPLPRSSGTPRLGEVHKAVLNATYDARTDGPLAEWESDIIGLSNCEAAEFILGEWKYPAEISSAIGCHYAPEKVPEDPALATLLNLAAGGAYRRGFGLPGELSYWDRRPGKLAIIGLDERQLQSASDAALERFNALNSAVS